MVALAALLFVIVPLVEIYAFIVVSHAIGVLNAIGLLLFCSLVGLWLAKREGFGVLHRIRATTAAGRVPGNELLDGLMIFFGGLLLVVPGFVTDALGLLLLLPPVRAGARAIAKRKLRVRVIGTSPSRGRIGPDDVIDV